MARVSIGRVWDETWAFLRAESALLFPVSAATIGVAILLLMVVMPEPVEGQLPRGPWMLWLLPFYGLSLLGMLANTALALMPGISVREGLGLAARRLPVGFAVVLLLTAISLLAGIPVALVSTLEAGQSGAGGAGTALANFIVLAALAWLSVRLLVVWPTVMDRPLSPIAAVREAFALTRGYGARLLGLILLAVVAAGLIGAALLFAGGSVLMVIGRSLGGERLGSLLVTLLMAAIVSVAATIWAVFVAFLYRQLGAVRSA
jgi:hypothetical protein